MRRSPELPRPRSADEWSAEAQRIRRHVLNDFIYHGWPKAWVDAPPQFEDTGAAPVPFGAGYRVHKLRYEVVPGFYSTAVLYEPEHLVGKAPAVLVTLGHISEGQAAPFQQKLCINMALRGMVALSIAFINMGELHHIGNEHYFGSDLDLVGVSGVGLFYLAMRRGLDYLYDDPHVDQNRIAVTGLSGGGWQAILLSALDPRVLVSIPVAGFDSLQGRLDRWPGERGDYEQLPSNLLEGQGYQTFAAMRAPRPTLELNNAEDACCFRAPLVKPYIYDAIRPFFRLYGKESDFQFHTDTQISAHNYQRDNRQQAYRFLCTYFHLPAKPQEIPVGQYLNSYSQLASGVPDHNMTILGLAKQFASAIHHRPVPADSAARDHWAHSERAKLSEVVHYQPTSVAHAWYVTNTNHNTIESISFRFTLSNGLSATGVWAKSRWTPAAAPLTVVINDQGRRGADKEVWDHGPEVADCIERSEQVLVLSILFTGDANPVGRGDPSRFWDLGSFGYMFSAVGAPPLGLEAAQLIGIAEWARSRWHPSYVRLESSGYRMQVVSLVAGTLAPHMFKSITIHQGMRSLNYILEKPVESGTAPDMFCLDLYKDYDLGILKALTAPTKVTESDYLELDPVKRR